MIYGNKGDTFVCRKERNNNNSKRLRIYESHMKPAPSQLVSSVGRAPHRYRRGHGLKSRTGLNFFRPYFHYCPSSANYCEDHFYSRHSKIITVLINLTQVSIHFSYMSRQGTTLNKIHSLHSVISSRYFSRYRTFSVQDVSTSQKLGSGNQPQK